MAITEYEAQRLRNIEANKALLCSLGLGEAFFPAQAKPPRAPPKKKRKSQVVSQDEEPERQAKSAKTEEGSDAVTVVNASREGEPGPRRSSRNAGKTVNYNEEQARSVSSVTHFKSARVKGTMGSDPRSISKRVHDPKQFGHIPGVSVGSWWESREQCSIDAIHAPWVAGISSSPRGAYSVALSGGYDDDVDLGYGFTYTGSGGRDLKGTKDKPKNLRTAPQSSDQTFDNPSNAALKKSAETQRPVRVIRGFKLPSRFAPTEGYRYDGLYVVEKAWLAEGNNPQGFLVCKFVFKRLPDQPPIPERGEDGEPMEVQDEDGEGEEEDKDKDQESDESVKSASASDDEQGSQDTKVADGGVLDAQSEPVKEPTGADVSE